MENFSSVNWWAVVVGAVASFLLGWLWYSPKLFGVKWAEGSRVELGSAQSMPVFAMVAQLVALFLLSTVVGLTSVEQALILAILVIVTVAVFAASMGGFVRKSSYAIAVDFFYIVAAGVVMILCQGLLRSSGA